MNKKLLTFVIVGLLGVGLWLYFSVFMVKRETFSLELRNDLTEISISLNSGNSTVDSVRGGELSGNVSFQGKSPRVEISNDISIEELQSEIKDVNLLVPEGKPVVFTYLVGAGNLDLNFRNLMVEQGTVGAGAGNVSLTLPATISSEFTLSVGAGNLKVFVPKGVDGLRFVPQDGTTLDFEASGYSFINGGYQTAGYANGETISTIALSAGSANLTVEAVE